jgi:nucleoside-diphosphate-sugar epimerase
MDPIAYEDDWRGGVESALTYELRAGDVPIRMRLSRTDGSGGEVLIECERGSISIGKTDASQIVVHPNGGGARPRRVALKHPFTVDRWPLDFHGSFCEMLSDFDRALRGETSGIADVRDAEGTTRLIEWAYERRNATGCRRGSVRNKPGVGWLITGATGFIGGHLLDYLSSHRDGEIRVAARSPASCSNISRYPIEIVPTDLLDQQQVEATIAGARVVFHLAYGRDGTNPSRVTIQGTKNVVDAAIACGAEAVVVLSTMYVFGFPTDVEMVDEGCPYRPYGGEYGESKAKMERWCLRRAKKSSKTRVVVLNPTCVFGPRGTTYTTLPVELAQQKRFCWIEGGVGLCNYTYVENLVDALVLASENTKVNGERFIINDGSTSWREFFDPFLKEIRATVPSYTKAELEHIWSGATSFSVGDLARAVLTSSEIRSVLRRSGIVRKAYTMARRSGLTTSINSTAMQNFSSGVTQTVAAGNLPPLWLSELFGASRVRFSAKHARDILGWSPRISLDVGRERTLQWLREAGHC